MAQYPAVRATERTKQAIRRADDIPDVIQALTARRNPPSVPARQIYGFRVRRASGGSLYIEGGYVSIFPGPDTTADYVVTVSASAALSIPAATTYYAYCAVTIPNSGNPSALVFWSTVELVPTVAEFASVTYYIRLGSGTHKTPHPEKAGNLEVYAARTGSFAAHGKTQNFVGGMWQSEEGGTGSATATAPATGTAPPSATAPGGGTATYPPGAGTGSLPWGGAGFYCLLGTLWEGGNDCNTTPSGSSNYCVYIATEAEFDYLNQGACVASGLSTYVGSGPYTDPSDCQDACV